VKYSRSTSITRRAATVAACCALCAAAAGAQQPAVLAPYRAPAIALVQPPGGGTVPQDKPVVVFRFAQGEPDDPIDVASFGITVDGQGRTTLFQLSAGEAWGPLASGDRGISIAPGAHQIAARICSLRGACGEMSAVVTVTAPATTTAEKARADRKRTLLDLVLAAARKLLSP
jgi:hypothetical protein